MHHPIAMKLVSEGLVGSDVILVSQQHCAQAAECFHLADELTGKTWRVNQDVATLARGSGNQVTPTAKTRFSSEPTKVDILRQQQRNSVGTEVAVVLLR